MPQEYIKTQDVLKYFGIKSTRTLHRWRKVHGFPVPVLPGRYSMTDIKAWENCRKGVANCE